MKYSWYGDDAFIKASTAFTFNFFLMLAIIWTVSKWRGIVLVAHCIVMDIVIVDIIMKLV